MASSKPARAASRTPTPDGRGGGPPGRMLPGSADRLRARSGDGAPRLPPPATVAASGGASMAAAPGGRPAAASMPRLTVRRSRDLRTSPTSTAYVAACTRAARSLLEASAVGGGGASGGIAVDTCAAVAASIGVGARGGGTVSPAMAAAMMSATCCTEASEAGGGADVPAVQVPTVGGPNTPDSASNERSFISCSMMASSIRSIACAAGRRPRPASPPVGRG